MLPPHDDRSTAPADLLLAGDDAAAVALRWRGFGRPSDLGVNLRDAARSALVTELLARCRVDRRADLPARRREARRMTVSGRIGGLAVIVARTTGRDELAAALRCPDADCQEPLEVSHSLGSLLDLSRRAEGERWLTIALPDAEPVRVRRPTGEDQLAWQSATYPTAAAAEAAMAASLVGQLPPSELSSVVFSAIDAALEESDPLTCFRIETICPACGRAGIHGIDLEALLLGEIRRIQNAIVGDIHALATQYGWSERAIAAMPVWRRRAYLERLEREAT